MPDKRGGRVVFVSHCLLDQNARFPGIAVHPGPVPELARGLADAGIGIEQLPCLEMKYWGGVSRKWAFLPMLGSMPSLVLPIAVRVYASLCAREARKVARSIGDFVRSGYQVLGVVAVDDSPTCGLVRTLRLTPSMLETARTSPDLAPALQGLLEEGSGLFMGSLLEEVRAKGLGVPFLTFDPWADPGPESAGLLAQILAQPGS